MTVLQSSCQGFMIAIYKTCRRRYSRRSPGVNSSLYREQFEGPIEIRRSTCDFLSQKFWFVRDDHLVLSRTGKSVPIVVLKGTEKTSRSLKERNLFCKCTPNTTPATDQGTTGSTISKL